MGKYGLTIDNLRSAEVVTAAGEVVTASPAEREDLFWALRGGAGNFGIVTSLEYRVHPVATVYGGVVAHPVSRAGAVLDFFREFTAEAPDELTAYFSLFAAPGQPEEKLAVIAVCHCDPAAAESDLKPLREFGPPLADTIAAMPYPVINTLSDAGYPRGALNYWKSAFFASLGQDALEFMGRRGPALPVTDERPEHHAVPRRREPGARHGHGLPAPDAGLQPADRVAVAEPGGHRGEHRVGQRDVLGLAAVYGCATVREQPVRRRRAAGPGHLGDQLRAAGSGQAALRPGQRLPAQPQHRSAG